ncbi:hypothetical protein J3D54_003955 [Pseudomonas sp. GGS8]|nr:hypothetical protein [Pseudomonas sp. GGS8]
MGTMSPPQELPRYAGRNEPADEVVVKPGSYLKPPPHLKVIPRQKHRLQFVEKTSCFGVKNRANNSDCDLIFNLA